MPSGLRRRASLGLGAMLAASTACGCHEDRARPAGEGSSIHPAGFADPSSPDFHGALLRASRWSAMLDPSAPSACGACHDGAPARPDGVTSSVPGAPACTTCHDRPGGVLACGTCHGTDSDPWPPTSAHPAHEAPTLTMPIDCASCHPVPAAAEAPGHLDGVVQIRFVGRAVARGARPEWNGTSCRDVACHGANLADPAAVPTWTDPTHAQSACGACHGIPPSQHTPSTSCDRSICHGAEVARDANGAPSITPSGRVLHVDGVIEGGP